MAPQNTTRDTDCCMPDCTRPVATDFEFPVCSSHARRVYRAVKDMLDSADLMTRIASAGPPKGKVQQGRGVMAGHVYFAQSGDLIKIGWSSNVPQRMRDLGTKPIHLIPGTMQDEKAMHHRFGAQWERGELFRNEGALADFLANV